MKRTREDGPPMVTGSAVKTMRSRRGDLMVVLCADVERAPRPRRKAKTAEAKVDAKLAPPPPQRCEHLLLCGALCTEITSPLLRHQVVVRPVGGGGRLHELVRIVDVQPRAASLTLREIKRAFTRTQYFGGSDGCPRTR
ncbi:hypothetical protein LCGC14_2604480, partial [marine sediment metagenome]